MRPSWLTAGALCLSLVAACGVEPDAGDIERFRLEEPGLGAPPQALLRPGGPGGVVHHRLEDPPKSTLARVFAGDEPVLELELAPQDGLVTVDLGELWLPVDALTGYLRVELFGPQEQLLAALEPTIDNLELDPGVTPELPSSAGRPQPTSGMGDAPTLRFDEGLSPVELPAAAVEEPAVEFMPTPPVPALAMGSCPSPMRGETLERSASAASPHAGDPVFLHSGEAMSSEQDLLIGMANGVDFRVVRTYRSRASGGSIVGKGWSINLDKMLLVDGSIATYKNGFGRTDSFTDGAADTPGIYARHDVDQNALIQSDGARVEFDASGRLARLVDRLGRSQSYHYDDLGRLVSVRDDATSLALSLEYRADGLLERIEDWTGRQLHYRYYAAGEPGGSPGDLKSVTATTQDTFPAGATTVYTYQFEASDPALVHNLVSTTRPESVAALGLTAPDLLSQADVDALRDAAASTTVYGADDRVLTQDDRGNLHEFSYGPGWTVVRDAIGNDKRVEFEQGRQTALHETVQGATTSTSFGYDGLGPEPTAIVEDSGRESQLHYDRANPDPLRRGDLLTQTRVGTGGELAQWAWTYDARGLPTSSTDPTARTTELEYDPSGRLIRVILPAVSRYDDEGAPIGSASSERTFAYDDLGRLIQRVAPDGVTTEYGYEDGLLRTIATSGNGSSTSLTTLLDYDALRRLNLVVGPTGAEAFVEYDPFNTLVRTVDALGAQTDYVHDLEARPIEVSRQHRVPDGDGSYLPATSEALYTRYTYDPHGHLIARTEGPDDRTHHFQRDAAGRLLRQTDPLGTATEWVLSPRGEVLSETLAAQTSDSATSLGEYTSDGSLAATIDAEGYRTEVLRDGLGRVQTLVDPLDNRVDLTLDARGRVVEERRVDAGGVVLGHVQRTLDEWGRVAVERDLLAGTTTVHHYTPGTERLARVSVSDPDGLVRETLYTHDPLGRLLSESDARGNTLAYEYAQGRLVAVHEVGELGQHELTTRFVHDALGRVVEVIEETPGGASSSRRFAFDSLNRKVEAIDENGHVTRYAYDSHSQLVEERAFLLDAADQVLGAQVVEYDYDQAGRLSQLRDSAGNTHSFEYNARGELVARMNPLGIVEFQHTLVDRRGLVLESQDPRGNVVHNHYDGLGRLVARDITRGPGVGGVTHELFSYDGVGRVLQAKNDTSAVSVSYDLGTGQPASVEADGATTSLDHDRLGSPLSMTYPAGLEVQHQPDALGRTVQTRVDGELLAQLVYEGSRERSRVLGGGAVAASHSYDGFGRRDTVAFHRKGELLADHSYVHDLAGNRVGETRSHEGAASEYVYNSLNELVSAQHTTASPEPALRELHYARDLSGNLLAVEDDGQATSFAVNAFNQVVAVDGQPLGWDASGNLVQGPDGDYAFDYANRLIRAELEGVVVEHDYDAFGRRVQTRASGETEELWRYVYDGDRVIESEGPLGLTTYVYNPTDGSPMAMRVEGVDYLFLTKDHGTVAMVTDAAGEVVERYEYDPYGARSIYDAEGSPRSSSAIGNELGFTGHRHCPHTGLIDMRSRWYHPQLRRFISQDTAGFVDGPNLYAYVSGNPTSLSDPAGTDGVPELFRRNKYYKAKHTASDFYANSEKEWDEVWRKFQEFWLPNGSFERWKNYSRSWHDYHDNHLEWRRWRGYRWSTPDTHAKPKAPASDKPAKKSAPIKRHKTVRRSSNSLELAAKGIAYIQLDSPPARLSGEVVKGVAFTFGLGGTILGDITRFLCGKSKGKSDCRKLWEAFYGK